MTAGELRKPVIIEHDVGRVADFGEGTESWKEYRRCWAAVRPRIGSERVEGQGVESMTSHEIKIRPDPDRPVDSTMRIRYGKRLFAIRGIVNPEEYGAYQLLSCDETAVWGVTIGVEP